MRSLKTRGAWRIAAGILLLMSLAWCVWIMTCSAAAGWLMHFDHYGDVFRVYGIITLIAAGMMTLAAGLCFLRIDLPAAVLAGTGWLPTLIVMLLSCSRAEEAGWSGQTVVSFGRTAAQVWREALMWDFIPAVLTVLLSLTRYFAYDNCMHRAAKNAGSVQDAPSILD